MYLHTTDYRFKHIYDIKTLKNYCDYAENDVKRAEETIRKIREYQRAIFKHVQEVINTPTKHVVKLERRGNYTTNKIEYVVSVEVRPIVEEYFVGSDHVCGTFLESERFPGTDRHKAVKLANELAIKYRCEIERTGKWRN